MTSTEVEPRIDSPKEVSPPLSNGFRSIANAVKTLSRGGVALTYTGLTIVDPTTVTHEDFEHLGSILGRLHDESKRHFQAFQWAIGDWVLFGQGRPFSDKVEQAALSTGRAPGTIANYTSIASRVVPSRRREELSFTHHEAVAALTPREQTKYLDLALSERDEDGKPMSVSDLRARIRDERPKQETLDGGGGGEPRGTKIVVEELVEIGRYIASRMQPTGHGTFTVELAREDAARLRAILGMEEQ